MKEKQIEEMAKTMCPNYGEESCRNFCMARNGCFIRNGAEILYNAGYRKQIDGEWKINSDGYYPYCPNCNTEPKNGVMSNFCPNCGAKMKGV